MSGNLTLHLGVKTDPIQYRYSYEWLFRLMAEEGVYHAQLGSFFEMYQLPDSWFVALRDLAGSYGVRISGVFTTHRELGGLFREDPAWHEAAVRSFRRMIEIAVLVGADAAGGNPGSVLRDRMTDKTRSATVHEGSESLLACSQPAACRSSRPNRCPRWPNRRRCPMRFASWAKR
jgi:ribulose-phosphate 3-epimerase